MELETFIKQTLLGIKHGLREANLELAKEEKKTLGVDFAAPFQIGPHEGKDGFITFDVAVTVSGESKSDVGGGLQIAIAKLGSDISEASSHEHVSRIKFSIRPSLFTG
jgi:hypothetical protein